MANLIGKKALHNRLKEIGTLRIDATLSLAYYGLVHGDVSALHGLVQSVANDLHREYKALVPAGFDKKSGEWTYNRKKAERVLEQYSLVFQETSFEDFCDAVMVEVEAKSEKTDEEKRAQAVTNVERSLLRALKLGIDENVLALLVKSAKTKL